MTSMYQQAQELFPINRSLTGNGVRQTLAYLKKLVPELTVNEVPSGTKAFDWTVPDEWNIEDAYIEDVAGNKIIDFKKNNLHVVGYSAPVDQTMSFKELDQYLYSLEDQPTAIPYITSYYSPRWGFCLTHNQRQELKKNPEKKYHAVIKSTLKPGNLTYGEILISGKSKKEIFLSTYVCHPSMANNEISGPVVTINLAQWIKSLNREYSYRILFLPETIGSIVYLSKYLDEMKKNVIAGFVVTCIGDDKEYSYLASKKASTLADRAALHILKHLGKPFKTYSYLDRGSDERQFCAQGIDLPVCSLMRSKYGTYPEYHTSLDNLDFISEAGLQGGLNILKKAITALENNKIYQNTILCEPQLGKRGLYPSLSTKDTYAQIKDMKNLIAYADGKKDLIQIADEIEANIEGLIEIANKLSEAGVLEIQP